MTNTAKTESIHLFEDAGMGVAPFKLIGIYSLPSASLAEHNPTAYHNQLSAMPKDVACGSCAYCHTAITHNYIIESSDKKRSAVGCDCVAKTGDKGLVNAIKLMEKKLRTEKRHAEQAEKFAQDIAKQRATNGGLTDDELFAKKRAIALQQRAPLEAAIVEKLAPFIQSLNRAGGDFCQSMSESLNECNLNLSDRCLRIIIEVAAKESGRRGSKKYNDRYDQLESIMIDAMADYEKLPTL